MFAYNETVENLIKREIDNGNIVGASMLVIHKNREIYHNTFGYADKENKVLMKRDTIFRMFSMTKPITAVAAMILAERGEIDLLDPVSKYFQEYKNQLVYNDNNDLEPAKREITISDLLNMTSGIPYPDDTKSGKELGDMLRGFIKKREMGERVTTQDYVRAIGKIPLLFQPGEKWSYGFSADILGGIIEIVSNKKFSEFLRDEIFLPLGMKDTGFFVPKEKRDRFAAIYRFDENEKFLKPFKESFLGEYYGEDVAFESGGAGLVSTLYDYSKFAMMMINKGKYNGVRILGRKTIEFMIKDKLTDKQKVDFTWDSIKGYGYGCLMRILINQGEAGTNASLGEFGWDGWTGNYIIMDPKEELIFMYFIQRCDSGVTPVVRKLRMATYAAIE